MLWGPDLPQKEVDQGGGVERLGLLKRSDGMLGGETPPNDGCGELRTDDVVIVEEPTDGVADGVEPRDRLLFSVEHLTVAVPTFGKNHTFAA